MFDRFTDRARKVLQLAEDEARRFRHEYVGTEHILFGLIREETGVAAIVLKNLNVDLRTIRLEVEKIVQSGPDDVVIVGKLPQTPRAKKVIEYAIEESRHLNHNYIGTEHLLLGLLDEGEGVASQILWNLGLRRDSIREELFNLGVTSEAGIVPNPLLIPQDETGDLPSEVRRALEEWEAQVEQLRLKMMATLLEQPFAVSASQREQADELQIKKRSILREWHLRYVIHPSWLAWNDGNVAKMAHVIAAEKRWEDLPILADALEDAGCTNAEMLRHCRDASPHSTSCWVVNLLRRAAAASSPHR